MKNSIIVPILVVLTMTACQSNQKTGLNSADSLKLLTVFKDSVEQEHIRNLTRAGDMVKAESPDALVEYEQGYALPRINDGDAQSPINIISANLKTNSQRLSDLRFTGSINEVENLGHTIQLDFAEGSITVAKGKTYELKQLHFHTPSEHLIDGMTFPMEMHIVSRTKDSLVKGGYAYTVVGILFKIGKENKFLSEFLSSIPKEEAKNGLDSAKVKLTDLLAGMAKRENMTYYHYQGSLTTPPYSESVNWVITSSILEASEEQITTLEKLEGNNARHVCALKNRKVEME